LARRNSDRQLIRVGLTVDGRARSPRRLAEEHGARRRCGVLARWPESVAHDRPTPGALTEGFARNPKSGLLTAASRVNGVEHRLPVPQSSSRAANAYIAALRSIFMNSRVFIHPNSRHAQLKG